MVDRSALRGLVAAPQGNRRWSVERIGQTLEQNKSLRVWDWGCSTSLRSIGRLSTQRPITEEMASDALRFEEDRTWL
jgi:anti-sigma-K factor RskA